MVDATLREANEETILNGVQHGDKITHGLLPMILLASQHSINPVQAIPAVLVSMKRSVTQLRK